MRCKICDSGEIGVEWTRDVMRGVRSVEEMGLKFGVSVDGVNEHLYTHEIVSPARLDSTVIGDEFYLDKLMRMLRQLESCSTTVMMEDKLDKTMIDSMTKLTKEIRSTITTIAEFQGRLDRSTTTINIQTVESKILKLTNVMVQEMCPECRIKLIPVIENL